MSTILKRTLAGPGLAFDFPAETIGRSLILNADCFEWLHRLEPDSLHAVVTDPPYGVKEYDSDQIEKRQNGRGGIWRIPPSFDGHTRAPLPRFTALNERERRQIKHFFIEWSQVVTLALRPGAHVIIASNTFLSQLVFSALVEGGLEFRGELIRLVRTLRGGDRPKNAEDEFPGVSSLPRGCYEPWGILRKPMPAGMKVSDCLREYQTGGAAAHAGRQAVQRRDPERAHAPARARHRQPSEPQASVLHAPTRPRRAASRRRRRRRSVHGRRLDGRGGGSHRLLGHRTRTAGRVFRGEPRRHPQTRRSQDSASGASSSVAVSAGLRSGAL